MVTKLNNLTDMYFEENGEVMIKMFIDIIIIFKISNSNFAREISIAESHYPNISLEQSYC